MTRTFALVDCNNFYASCERLFRPELKDVPVAVLSNNDGCIVARSQEVKALGIKMGTPLFKVADIVKQHQVQVFSSNYSLYGDISARVMQTLEQFSPSVELYSIDEAFLELSGFSNLEEYGHSIRSTVYQHVGVPVCVGIAPTKTLAKLANYAAKKFKATGGVVDLSDPARQKKLLSIVPVSEIWGVGRKHTRSLEEIGITTALQLAQLDPRQIRQHYSVVMERTVRELNGEACIELDEAPAPKQQIVCSRSFGEKITDSATLRECLCEFTARAAEKLRGERQLTSLVNVFIRTSPFIKTDPYYGNSATGRLANPSSDTRELLTLTAKLFEAIWKEGYRYAKAGVMLGDFCSSDRVQYDLFTPIADDPQPDKLMQTLDNINHTGLGKIWFGGQRPRRDWFMKQELLSPAYTTRWDCLPLV
ncbi:MAG: translesion error-prone DNA polymerase V subunit UmuC [Deltaproteobacteria bacterium]|jgi:DNA polymerase V|nr:translesion error-prone DNA polymerase V subunit UmuC [Deltaproteobacteria bacterium]MCW8892557.1 translesion error-prone DNA polymerase V subunit UmuC [Deltaproteobacteria bacterium]MCW9048737.1 translesion error-prone DNA polymerase V subunit UmuC [Deltaproteobacteria bacterium]